MYSIWSSESAQNSTTDGVLKKCLYLSILDVLKAAEHSEHLSFSVSPPGASGESVWSGCLFLAWVLSCFSVLKSRSQWSHWCFSSQSSSSEIMHGLLYYWTLHFNVLNLRDRHTWGETLMPQNDLSRIITIFSKIFR